MPGATRGPTAIEATPATRRRGPPAAGPDFARGGALRLRLGPGRGAARPHGATRSGALRKFWRLLKRPCREPCRGPGRAGAAGSEASGLCVLSARPHLDSVRSERRLASEPVSKGTGLPAGRAQGDPAPGPTPVGAARRAADPGLAAGRTAPGVAPSITPRCDPAAQDAAEACDGRIPREFGRGPLRHGQGWAGDAALRSTA